MIPDDLKNYRAEDSFQLIAAEDAGKLLLIGLALILFLDYLGMLPI